MGRRARILRCLITVCVLMWPPSAKLSRSAPAVLNGRCRGRLDMSRFTCTWTVSNIPRLTKTLPFPPLNLPPSLTLPNPSVLPLFFPTLKPLDYQIISVCANESWFFVCSVSSFIFYWFGIVCWWRNVNCERFMGRRTPWWWRRLITVCVLMWPPSAKLSRSAPAVPPPPSGSATTHKTFTVDITSSTCSIWLVTWSFGVNYSHM
jgi:hypothetical protein